MSSDVFIIATARNPQGAAALQQALETAGVLPGQVQDVVFGLDSAVPQRALETVVRSAGIACAAASVVPSLRAIFFAAASILSDEVQLSLAAGGSHEAAVAFVLASPEAVGRLNLLPCARIAARSLAGREAALRQASLAGEDIDLAKDGQQGILLLHDLLDGLVAASRRWGLVTEGDAALMVERL